MHSGVSKTDEAVLAAAADVAATKTELEARTTALRGRLESLNGQWEGRGHVAFQAAITSWQQTADRLVDVMDDFEAALRASEATYERSEDDVAQELNRYHGALAQ